MLSDLIDLFLQLDQHLDKLIASCGVWIYVILFAVVFCETGLVVTPFLPGDSLLFAIGTLAAGGSLDITACFLLLTVAAILGDTVNYWLGARIGPKVFSSAGGRLLNKEHLVRAARFYEKHGGKTIIIARFVPIIRTFAPFVAGIGRMHYPRFLAYNVFGGLLWVVLLLFGGYFFGNIPIVKNNFSIVVVVIIVISVLPVVVEFLRARAERRRAQSQT